MSRFVLPHIAGMAGYIPGEQPRELGILKLNTNENPYPPSPRVDVAIQSGLDGRLRRYPDPVGTVFRQVAAQRHNVDPSMVLVGNGSDDLLTIITRTFVSPGDKVVFPTPSYILYQTLVELQNGRPISVNYEADWTLGIHRFTEPRPRLAFLANPNSPSGTSLPPETVAELANRLDCPLVVDEAYADFAETNCLSLVHNHPNIIVTRSLSKGLSLAGLRVGYLIARPEIVHELVKVKDSYNCDSLSLLGGAAALDDEEYLALTRGKIVKTRERLTLAARELGYHVPESQANFIWCTEGPPAVETYEALKARRILVRLMQYAGYPDGLRITVGTDEEIDRLLDALTTIIPSTLARDH